MKRSKLSIMDAGRCIKNPTLSVWLHAQYFYYCGKKVLSAYRNLHELVNKCNVSKKTRFAPPITTGSANLVFFDEFLNLTLEKAPVWMSQGVTIPQQRHKFIHLFSYDRFYNRQFWNRINEGRLGRALEKVNAILFPSAKNLSASEPSAPRVILFSVCKRRLPFYIISFNVEEPGDQWRSHHHAP